MLTVAPRPHYASVALVRREIVKGSRGYGARLVSAQAEEPLLRIAVQHSPRRGPVRGNYQPCASLFEPTFQTLHSVVVGSDRLAGPFAARPWDLAIIQLRRDRDRRVLEGAQAQTAGSKRRSLRPEASRSRAVNFASQPPVNARTG